MKVLAISFGRKMHNCDIVAIQALKAAQEAGAEVKFVNTMRMKIQHCIGCGGCSGSRDRGGQIKCVIKDDYLALEEDMLNADAIIVVAPIYALGPTGQMKNVIDRFGAAHDLASATAEQEKRIAENKPLLDERMFERKCVAYISVGGCHTPNWVSLGLPNFYMFGMSTAWGCVGMIDAYDMGHRVNPVLDEPFMEEVSALGRHIVEQRKKPVEEREWLGQPGICPVCHNRFISIPLDYSTTVECPMCGIEGELKIEDGKVKVDFSEQQKARARCTITGLYEHHYELHDMMDIIIPTLQTRGDEIAEKMKPFKEFKSTY